jgi:hypothetical protein
MIYVSEFRISLLAGSRDVHASLSVTFHHQNNGYNTTHGISKCKECYTGKNFSL